jgi:hypothetical protein
MATIVSNKLTFLLAKKVIDFSADVFKIILMGSGFVFNVDTHAGYADVSGSELPTGNGYTAGGVTLAGVAVTQDDVDDRTEITWTNASWTASGGDIGPSPGAIIYDDTPTTPVADPIIGYIDFGGNQSQPAGGVATIASIEVRIGKPS